jgi:hypothetical protein
MQPAGGFPSTRVTLSVRILMAAVLNATAGDGTPSLPGPTEQSSRDRDRTIAGYLLSSHGRMALVTTKARDPRWWVHRRRVRHHVHRVATALKLRCHISSPVHDGLAPLIVVVKTLAVTRSVADLSASTLSDETGGVQWARHLTAGVKERCGVHGDE